MITLVNLEWGLLLAIVREYLLHELYWLHLSEWLHLTIVYGLKDGTFLHNCNNVSITVLGNLFFCIKSLS